ncbi:MAG: AbrB/MazE/SpoVT family DNA-binding domain-containing protein [Cyanobacteriota bacterium]|nr:AbrB/MazE/SpoVT family DNA-binding domain-containing protein [Cyanobacteriota bacterium]
MDKLPKLVEVHLDREGQLVIPAALRQSLGSEQGDLLIAHDEEGRLVLEKRETIKQRLKARFAKLPKDQSLASELIAERREEARREIAE